MENKAIAGRLKLLAQLMELHEGNPFKIKALTNSARKVDKSPVPLAGLSVAELEKIDGIGKSTAIKIAELNSNGSLPELDDWVAKTPSGIVDMLAIKGLGPKKILTIWKQLDIENIGELLYACNENRLVEAKGFGAKTQEEVRKILEFTLNNEGKFLYARVENTAEKLLSWLKKSEFVEKVEFTGSYRRKCEILTEVDYLLSINNLDNLIKVLEQLKNIHDFNVDGDLIRFTSVENVKFQLNICPAAEFAYKLLISTGNETHLKQLSDINELSNYKTAASEQEIYQALGLDYIEPELREGMQEISMAASKRLPKLITYNHLKGSLHNHTTYSDGVHTLEEMARQCIENGYEYLGVCDHSKSAFYASGLSEERVRLQHAEIDQLNQKLSPFRIFKGIESDILYDGSLDYSSEILAGFDFIVASVHSQLKMPEEKATQRLITAIENPYTTILGHPTGRLLLAREGYPINYKKVIDACAANGVVIEINANPLRLDLDWRWIQYALGKNVMLSINPDAHRKESFTDMRYGVMVARKGGLMPEMCLNTLSAAEIDRYFKNRTK